MVIKQIKVSKKYSKEAIKLEAEILTKLGRSRGDLIKGVKSDDSYYFPQIMVYGESLAENKREDGKVEWAAHARAKLQQLHDLVMEHSQLQILSSMIILEFSSLILVKPKKLLAKYWVFSDIQIKYNRR